VIEIGFLGYLPELRGFKHADKVTHVIYGAVIGLVAAAVASCVGLAGYWPALIAATIAGIMKEIYDAWVSDGLWDIWDIVATIIVPLLALGLSWLG